MALMDMNIRLDETLENFQSGMEQVAHPMITLDYLRAIPSSRAACCTAAATAVTTR